MGAPRLLFGGRRLTAAKIIAASSQGTVRPLQPEAGRGNVGSLSLVASGNPAAALNHRVEILDEGAIGTATFKVSVDGGANYLGRKVDTTWDGNGAASRTIVDEADNRLFSRPVPIDTNGDGIPDRVLLAALRFTATYAIDILSTSDFSGAGSWSVYDTSTSGSSTPVEGSISLVEKSGALFLFFDTAGGLVVKKSVDYGLTWGAAIVVDANGTYSDAIVLASGKILVAYLKTISTYAHVVVKSSADGAVWSAAKQVTTGSVNFSGPSLIQEADGKTICFHRRVTATAAIQARQATALDPAATATTWATYSETLWAGGTTDKEPSAAIAPDGTIFVAFSENDLVMKYSKFKDGDANYSADAEIIDPSAACQMPRIASVGGSLWCVFSDISAATKGVLVLTRYWTAYDDSAAPASQIGIAPQFIADNIWYTWGGSLGKVGDYWTIASSYINDAGNMLRYIKNRPAKSSNDTADWYVVLDAGANNVFAVNGVCLAGNFNHAHFQMHASDSWGTPSLNETINMVRATYAATSGYTLPGGGRIKFTAGGMEPRGLIGKCVQFATSGITYEIADNDADEAYVDGVDLVAEAGVMSLFSPKKWISFAAARYRFIRLLVQIQDTADGVFIVPAMLAGMWTTLSESHVVQVAHAQALDIKRFRSGQTGRAKNGSVMRNFGLIFSGPTEAEKDEVLAQLTAHDFGVAPFALIPDSDDSFDFAIVAPPEGDFNPAAVDQFSVALEEII